MNQIRTDKQAVPPPVPPAPPPELWQMATS